MNEVKVLLPEIVFPLRRKNVNQQIIELMENLC